MAAALWQRTSPFLATDSNFLGQTQHSCGSTGSLLSRHGSLRTLAVPPPKNAGEMDSIWDTRRHYTEHDGQALLHSQRGIPEMLRTMAEPLGEGCSVTARLLRRGLGFQTSRRVNVFFRPKVGYFLNRPRILPTYIIKGRSQQILILSEFFLFTNWCTTELL